MPVIAQWNATWAALGVLRTPALDAAFESLVARYAEPHRRYHTLDHLDHCLGVFAGCRELAEHPAEVELAIWFHDAVYDTQSSLNEARSAALAKATVRAAGAPDPCAQRIGGLVMATRHAEIPVGVDAKALVDVDLSILGAEPRRFDEYERQVREEYAWMPGPAFREGRRKIVEAFLARPAIFNTTPFRDRLEARARANIERSLRAL